MLRSTKIVATLGPSSNDPATLKRLLEAGVNMVRLNFSHGTAQDHIARAATVREIAHQLGRPVAILVDLQGPKIRVGKFENGKITLEKGAHFILDAECTLGNQERVGLDYKELPNDVEPGAILLLNDGLIKLVVDEVRGPAVHCSVLLGGVLSNNKGINRQGGGLTAPALTDKDKEDIKTAAILKTDYVAVSFPKSGADMELARKLLQAAGSDALLIAKIERTEAIGNLEDILNASDGIMVARGDLAVEVGEATVPTLQKKMIKLARKMNKLSITATQMMESMIENPVPTRAEVSDVANAVLDGTDAVMLSAESAAGKFPVETVEVMARTCLAAEQSQGSKSVTADAWLGSDFSRVDQAISMSALYAAEHLNVKAIGALTQTGFSAQWISRYLCGVPIYAITPVEETYHRLSLMRNVSPIWIQPNTEDHDQQLLDAEMEMLRRGLVQKGDIVVFIFGDVVGIGGGTNSMKIIKVGGEDLRRRSPRQ